MLPSERATPSSRTGTVQSTPARIQSEGINSLMSTRSLIGTLDADGRSFRARYCHSDGYPQHQVPALARALEVFGGDLDTLTTTILSNEWSLIAPIGSDEDSTERGSSVANATRVGRFYADSLVDLDPEEGQIDEDPIVDRLGIEWLYLFSEEQLRVYASHIGNWMHFADFPLADLPTTGEQVDQHFSSHA